MPRLPRGELRNTGTECDENFFRARKKKVPRQRTLQSRYGFDTLIQRGVGHQYDKLFAAITCQGILHAHAFSCHARQVGQRGITGAVAFAVVELFEIVDVEQRHA